MAFNYFCLNILRLRYLNISKICGVRNYRLYCWEKKFLCCNNILEKLETTAKTTTKKRNFYFCCFFLH